MTTEAVVQVVDRLKGVDPVGVVPLGHPFL